MADDNYDESGDAAAEAIEEMIQWRRSLPAHSCTYCGIHDTTTVARCAICKRWFCNAPTPGSSSASHIVTHLVRSKHKEIVMHAESPLGEAPLECYNCGCRNVFLLGFIPSADASVVVLLCREPCAASGGLRELNWDLAQWQPLIDEQRAFVPWLLQHPSVDAEAESRPFSNADIQRLETLWRANPDASIEELLAKGAAAEDEIPLSPVLLRYDDAYQYQNVFAPLVHVEEEYDRMVCEAMSHHDVTVTWELSADTGNRLARFCLPRAESDLRLTTGDELRLRHSLDTGRVTFRTISSSDTSSSSSAATAASRAQSATEALGDSTWEAIGQVVHLPGDDEVVLELRLDASAAKKLPLTVTTGFSVDFVWRPTSFLRMQVAMKRFALHGDSSMSPVLHNLLLGHVPTTIEEERKLVFDVPPPERLSVPGLPELNQSQAVAVRNVLSRPLSVIQGPPGTGKTLVSAAIIYHFARHVRRGQVLVCAPSNVAVDQLADKAHTTGLRVVRVTAKSRETIASSVEPLTLHAQVAKLNTPKHAEFQKLRARREKQQQQLTKNDLRRYKELLRLAELDVLRAAEVICCTCVTAGDPRFKGLSFKLVLVDECTQATEPEALIPLVLGAQQVVLVGDHQQLGPVVMCKRAAAAGLSQSLFERMVVLGFRPVRLEVQYRMHPTLSEFPSVTFYDGVLQNGVTVGERTLVGIDFPFPTPERPMMFYNIVGNEEISASGTSYLNRTEAAAVERILSQLLRGGVKAIQIGVITPYEGQRSYIHQHITRHGQLVTKEYDDIEIASVDAFQGREKDFIVLSTVRSNEARGIGFLVDPRRLNVALTRCKYGLIVLGNARVLSRDSLWYALLVHFKQHGLLVEGPLTALQQSSARLQRPRKQRRFGAAQQAVAAAAAAGGADASAASQQSQQPVHTMFTAASSRYDARSVLPRYGGSPQVAASDTMSMASQDSTGTLYTHSSQVSQSSLYDQEHDIELDLA